MTRRPVAVSWRAKRCETRVLQAVRCDRSAWRSTAVDGLFAARPTQLMLTSGTSPLQTLNRISGILSRPDARQRAAIAPCLRTEQRRQMHQRDGRQELDQPGRASPRHRPCYPTHRNDSGIGTLFKTHLLRAGRQLGSRLGKIVAQTRDALDHDHDERRDEVEGHAGDDGLATRRLLLARLAGPRMAVGRARRRRTHRVGCELTRNDAAAERAGRRLSDKRRVRVERLVSKGWPNRRRVDGAKRAARAAVPVCLADVCGTGSARSRDEVLCRVTAEPGVYKANRERCVASARRACRRNRAIRSRSRTRGWPAVAGMAGEDTAESRCRGRCIGQSDRDQPDARDGSR